MRIRKEARVGVSISRTVSQIKEGLQIDQDISNIYGTEKNIERKYNERYRNNIEEKSIDTSRRCIWGNKRGLRVQTFPDEGKNENRTAIFLNNIRIRYKKILQSKKY